MAVPHPVLGHAELASSDPAANSVLVTAPDALRLTFTEPVDAASSRISLLDTRQAEIPGLGDPSLDAAGTTVSVSLPDLEPGTYTVSYQVTSASDGHVTSGIFAFLIDPTGTQPAPAVSSQTASLSSGLEVIAARWLALLGALVLVGVLLFWVASARPALARGTAAIPTVAPWGLATMAAAVALGGLISYLVLGARPIVAAGEVPASPLPLDFAAPFGWTPFAIAMRVAQLGLVAAVLIGLARWLAPAGNSARDRLWLAGLLAAGVLALAGMSLGGHAAAEGGYLFAAFDLLHLLSVAAWIGTLPGLFLLALRARGAVPAALRRHSRVALVAAPVVVLTGLASSPVVLGPNARELVASGYGNLLLSKAALFSVAVGLGAVNYFLVRSDEPGRSLAVIGGELAVGALAILAAAGMVTGQPAANRAPVVTASGIGAAHLYGIAGPSSVHAAVTLPSPGNQLYQVSVADATSGVYRTDVQRVILVFTPPADSGLAEERIQLVASGDPGLWGATGTYTPVVGQWGLEVIVRRPGERDESTSFSLPVTEPLPPRTVPPPDTGVGVPLPLAALWGVLPAGSVGWAVPVGLLVVAAGISLADRLRRRGWAGPLAVGIVALAVIAGLAAGSRAAVQAANQPPASAVAAANPVPASADSVRSGRELYLANCAACHGTTGAGDGPTAESMLPPPPDLATAVPRLSDGSLAYRIAVGTAGTRMPAFGATLSEQDRWDLVNYLRSTWTRR